MKTEEVVEILARMSLEQRKDFVEVLSTKWPHLAESIGNMITLEISINKSINGLKEAV